MAFTINITAAADVPNSMRVEYDTEFRVALAEQGVAAQLATVKKDIGAKSIELPKYDQLALATTPLVDGNDVDSEKLIDSKVTLTPQEFGKAVTTTKLANLQSGGMVDRAAAKMVGINAGRTENKLATMAMDASANVYYVGGGAASINVTQADIMTGTVMGKMFNRLARKNVIGLANGDYVMVAHDDVIHSIREGSGANSWIDAHKYALPQDLLRNEVGMYKGFRVIRDNMSTVEVGAGDLGIDVYTSYFVGFNALGLAVSDPIHMVASGPYDKLNRILNFGHLGTYTFGIVEADALWVVKSASDALL